MRLERVKCLDLADLLPQPQIDLGNGFIIDAIGNPFPSLALSSGRISQQQPSSFELSQIRNKRRWRNLQGIGDRLASDARRLPQLADDASHHSVTKDREWTFGPVSIGWTRIPRHPFIVLVPGPLRPTKPH